MQDRFKFRAFYQGRFIYKSLTDANYYDKDNKCIGLANTLPNDLVWEQCTGLKDINGVWIYEGDIIRLEDSESCIYHTKCVWNSYYKAGYYLICGSTGQEFYITRNDLEVIGNVYENPELLEKIDD